MSAVLITGIRGFTGQFLATELRTSGYQVYGTVFAHQPKSGEYSVDICEPSQVCNLVNKVRPDYVIHLAAITFVDHIDVDAIYHTNVVGTRNLLQALSEMDDPPDLVLLASSANIYGNANVDPIIESTVANPANDYAVSKVAMEHMASLWMDQLPITIVRPFNYTGVGQTTNFLIPKIVSHFQRKEKTIELGSLEVARDFSDVRVVTAAYLRILESNLSGKIFNICSGTAISLKTVLSLMRDIAGYRINVKVNPEFVRNNEVTVLRGDNSSLLQAIGQLEITPMRQTLEWMYKEGVF